MKLTRILTAVFACMLVIALIGCGQKESSETTDTTKMEETTKAVEMSFEETKDAFVTSAKSTLEAMDTQIADAKETVAAMPEMAQKPLNSALENIDTYKSEAADKLAEVENADEAAFDAAKEAYTTSVSKLETSLSDLTSKF